MVEALGTSDLPSRGSSANPPGPSGHMGLLLCANLETGGGTRSVKPRRVAKVHWIARAALGPMGPSLAL
jgi:hypothetical protein